MRIDAIELEGFQSYRDRERVELGGINLAAIIGPNHVGKSTIVSDALMYALYGASRGSTVNDVISRGEQKATVTLEFTAQGTKYRIVRFRTRKGRSEAALYVADPEQVGGWRDLSEKNPAAAEEGLRDLLGMNADTARLTWMISQGDFGAFCDLQPAPRRRVLADAFNLGQYAELRTAAEGRRDRASKNLQAVDITRANVAARVESLNAPGPYPMLDDDEVEAAGSKAEKTAEEFASRLANLDDPQVQSRLVKAKDTLGVFEQSHRSAVEQHRRTVSHVRNVQAQSKSTVDALMKELSTAQEAQWAMTDMSARVQAASQTVSGLEARVGAAREHGESLAGEPSRLAAVLESITFTAKEIGEQIGTLQAGRSKSEGVCFTCGQGLSDSDAELLIKAKGMQQDELRDRYRKVSGERTVATQAVANARAEVQALEADLVRARTELRTVEAEAARVANQAGAVDRLQTQVADAKTQYEKATVEVEGVGPEPVIDQERLRVLRQDVTDAQKAVADASEGAGRRQEYQQKVTAAREESRLMWQEKQRRTLVASELAQLRPKLAEAVKDVQSLTEQVKTYSLLVEAFAPSGIPSMILAGVVEELNEDANEILGSLGADGLGVNVSTQREKARGGVDEKVMIYAITAHGEADYKTLSGSEKFRVALAIRLGLARCIARRTGSPVETIVMDEGWGALDEETKLAVQEVLSRLSTEFSVFTVSHIDDVRSAFPTVIDVSAESGTSRCTIRQMV